MGEIGYFHSICLLIAPSVVLLGLNQKHIVYREVTVYNTTFMQRRQASSQVVKSVLKSTISAVSLRRTQLAD